MFPVLPSPPKYNTETKAVCGILHDVAGVPLITFGPHDLHNYHKMCSDIGVDQNSLETTAMTLWYYSHESKSPYLLAGPLPCDKFVVLTDPECGTHSAGLQYRQDFIFPAEKPHVNDDEIQLSAFVALREFKCPPQMQKKYGNLFMKKGQLKLELFYLQYKLCVGIDAYLQQLV